MRDIDIVLQGILVRHLSEKAFSMIKLKNTQDEFIFTKISE